MTIDTQCCPMAPPPLTALRPGAHSTSRRRLRLRDWPPGRAGTALGPRSPERQINLLKPARYKQSLQVAAAQLGQGSSSVQFGRAELTSLVGVGARSEHASQVTGQTHTNTSTWPDRAPNKMDDHAGWPAPASHSRRRDNFSSRTSRLTSGWRKWKCRRAKGRRGAGK